MQVPVPGFRILIQDRMSDEVNFLLSFINVSNLFDPIHFAALFHIGRNRNLGIKLSFGENKQSCDTGGESNQIWHGIPPGLHCVVYFQAKTKQMKFGR